jgi:hypothetical protein
MQTLKDTYAFLSTENNLDEAEKARLRNLDSLSFQSLTLAGIDWRKIVRENPELQKEYYKLLNLRKDWIIVNMDYSQLELYVLASISGDKNMITTVMSGKDIHSENTKKIHGIDYEDLEYRFNLAIPGTTEFTELEYALNDFKAKRKSTKALSFSLSYGAGKEKIAMDNRITNEEANDLINGFYSIYPDVKTWQNATFLTAIQTGYIETPFGRRRATAKVHNRMDAYYALVDENPRFISSLKKSGEYWNLREEFKTCKNTPIQSVASDMCSLAAIKFKEWLKTANKRAEMYFWVHDAIVFAVHIDDAVDVIENLRSIMENDVKYPGDPVTYRAALDVGYNYEWTVEIKRNEWLSGEDQKALLLKKLDEAIEKDKKKKFKLIVKSSSLEMDESYLKKIKEAKEDYFENLVSKLGIDGIHTPQEYMAYMNDISPEEYEEAMNLFDDEDDEEE